MQQRWRTRPWALGVMAVSGTTALLAVLCSVGMAVAQPNPQPGAMGNQPGMPGGPGMMPGGPGMMHGGPGGPGGPMMPPPVPVMVVANGNVYILAGPMLYVYDARDLKLKAQTQLPEPPRRPGGPGGQGEAGGPPMGQPGMPGGPPPAAGGGQPPQ